MQIKRGKIESELEKVMKLSRTFNRKVKPHVLPAVLKEADNLLNEA